ncbi:MAG: MauE/DoxX family redox-associated membrane protein [Bacteroidota bacterium]
MATLNVMRTKRLREFLRYALVLFMLFAGLNHFIHPQFYLPLIPDYFPFPQIINVVSGALEVILSLFLLNKTLKRVGVYGILLLLVVFIPSHVHFIQLGACVEDGLCTPLWVAWVRLLVIHPIVLLWVWAIRKT